ncbi:uncharacterized protein N7484_005822 [Penicillium longicatenatum]|uniref:uncharacterized protein n=1 Tax=Penicillium longicatenatum TaxID=1561947 RepID=UPI0025467EDC|nr:uncharacterized protein N7484_005822 [Penicillium longicatenatum]KAJ5643315.1 hypothetical protein N7484_005822 [Penicillium longicatenatum]
MTVRQRDPLLYPGEVLETVAGFPTLYHYQASQKQHDHHTKLNPLVVCIPGSMHLSRIFYGGHKGSNPRDFLAYQLSKLHFDVLSLSYPLETDPEIMPTTGANFRIQDWGRQAAATVKKIMEEKDLTTRSIILIAWSMAGRMIVPFNVSAKELGLDVQQFISFAATPGISSIRTPTPGMACSEAGYFCIPDRLDNFYQQVKVMEKLNGGQTPIPKEIFLREYVGGTPINLTGVRLKYDGKGAFIQDELTHEEDTKVFDVANLPFITALYPTDILDASHALTDRASWGFLMSYQLEAMIGKQGLQKVKGTAKWQELIDFVHAAPERLCYPAPGSHFFFVGETSASEVAAKVVTLISVANEFKKELSLIIS